MNDRLFTRDIISFELVSLNTAPGGNKADTVKEKREGGREGEEEGKNERYGIRMPGEAARLRYDGRLSLLRSRFAESLLLRTRTGRRRLLIFAR